MKRGPHYLKHAKCGIFFLKNNEPRVRVQGHIKAVRFYSFGSGGLCDFRSMKSISDQSAVDFRTVFHALVEQIEQGYSLNVTIGPVTGSYTGQFDGKEIWVDLDKDPEEAVFILA